MLSHSGAKARADEQCCTQRGAQDLEANSKLWAGTGENRWMMREEPYSLTELQTVEWG
jgi:hypothetical protein